jgi:peptidoglycan/xylan/chitin deacetylase (PgdA/CDA1 family)
MRRQLASLVRNRARSVRRRFEGHALVLMYHRIAEPDADPWKLCVSRRNFAEQLALLGSCATVLPLREIAGQLRKTSGARPLVAVTFDDGYADNLHEALPTLQRAGLPATVFVSTGLTGRGDSFWWEQLADLILGPGERPGNLQIAVQGFNFAWPRGLTEDRTVLLPAERVALHHELWNELRVIPDALRADVLGQLRMWSGRPRAVDPLARPLTEQEVAALHGSGLVEIGAHARSHRFLTELPPGEREAEIRGSRDDCTRMTGVVPTSFAYPHGAVDDLTASAVHSAGFQVACCSHPGLMWSRGDRFRVPRIVAPDIDGEAFERTLSTEWLP